MLLYSFLSFIANTALAVELYSIFDKKCKEFTGYIIAENNDVYEVLSTHGQIQSFHKNNIKGILTYNFVSPPLTNINIPKSKTHLIKNLSIDNESKIETFSGFPVQFIEDLIVFLGLDGNIRVHKLDNVLKIRPINSPLKNNKLTDKNFSIQSAGYIQSCGDKGQTGSSRPNRILIDKIKIQQFLSTYKTGYENLQSFEERTYLYSRPQIYKQKTRFGLISQKPQEPSAVKNSLPFVEWSSGRPYRVQSYNRIGVVFDEYGASWR